MPGKRRIPPADPKWFDNLPDAALVREHQIIAVKDNPNPLISVSPSTWWRWVRLRKAPQPLRLSSGVTMWRVGELRKWLADPGAWVSPENTLVVNTEGEDHDRYANRS